MIGEYASLHGNLVAVHHFSKEFGVEMKESSVTTWNAKYLAAVNSKRRAGETNDLEVKCLPVKKRGRPLLLGEKLDTEVKYYIQAVRQGGGVITAAINMAAATAIVRRADRNLLVENGGPISITTNWAKSLLYRLNCVKRRGRYENLRKCLFTHVCVVSVFSAHFYPPLHHNGKGSIAEMSV